jgi:hypothetical protein
MSAATTPAGAARCRVRASGLVWTGRPRGGGALMSAATTPAGAARCRVRASGLGWTDENEVRA